MHAMSSHSLSVKYSVKAMTEIQEFLHVYSPNGIHGFHSLIPRWLRYGAETLGTCGNDKPVVITEGKVTSPDMRTSNPKFFRIYVVTMR
jgi:hypothetical protein